MGSRMRTLGPILLGVLAAGGVVSLVAPWGHPTSVSDDVPAVERSRHGDEPSPDSPAGIPSPQALLARARSGRLAVAGLDEPTEPRVAIQPEAPPPAEVAKVTLVVSLVDEEGHALRDGALRWPSAFA